MGGVCEVELNLVDYVLYEYKEYSEWVMDKDSFNIDSGHGVITDGWDLDEDWGYIIVELG